jgi:branched-chain amino acid transport system permease protein
MSARAYPIAALLAILLALAAPNLVSSFYVTLFNYIGVYALVAIGLTLLTGVAGVVSFGQAAFVGIAAYATAWLTTTYGVGAWAGLALALAATMLAALAIGLVTMRLKGHLLSLSTVAWGLAIGFCFGNIDGLGNFTGMSGIPPIFLGPLSLAPTHRIYYLILFVVVAALWLSRNLLDSRIGRAMRALRGGALLVESVGVDPFVARLTAFLLAAGLAALSGWLYAHLGRFVSPTPFDAGMGIEYLMMAMIGGAASPLGGLIGAALITMLKNAIQDVLPLIARGAAAQLEIVVFSGLFILFLQRAREGVTPWVAGLLPRVVPPPPPSAPPLARRAPPPSGAPLLTLEGVSRRFKGLVAVNDLSFDVKPGEILGLIGPNGAGKSTTFNLITGALPPSGGVIRFRGETISGRRQFRIARAGIARTFQHVKLRPRMSALDNVLIGAFGRLTAGVFKGALRLDRAEEASARFEAQRLLARVGLGERAYDLAGQLSLGEQRLLEIARALMTDPVLLVLDEPAAGLRRPEKIALADVLRALRGEGLTILVVEHDMDFVMGLVDRLVVMDFGCKLAEGAPVAVRADARVREAYLGGVA